MYGRRNFVRLKQEEEKLAHSFYYVQEMHKSIWMLRKLQWKVILKKIIRISSHV